MRAAIIGSMLLMGMGSTASAQQPPKKLWTKLSTSMAHANVAGAACSLQGRTVVEGKYRPIEIHAQEDNAVLCWSGQPNPEAVHVGIFMTAGSPEVVIQVDVPDGASPQAIEDLRGALRSTEGELQKRVGAPPPQQQVVQAPPIQVVPAPPPVPMHAVQETNWGLAGAGLGVMAGGYLLTALVGAAILDASGDPGTQRFWPFVPFFGATVFSATYKEAPGCECSAGRVFAVFGSVVIDAVQVAGLVMTVVGFASTKTRMVPDAQAKSWRILPNGSLEVRF